MNTDTLEIFNNSDEWASQLKHALSQGENLALLHGLTPDILDRIYAYAFDYWICPYISRHLLSLNPLLACCSRYSRGER